MVGSTFQVFLGLLHRPLVSKRSADEGPQLAVVVEGLIESWIRRPRGEVATTDLAREKVRKLVAEEV